MVTATVISDTAAFPARRRFNAAEMGAMVEAGILAPGESIRRFTVDEYYALAEAGILAPRERVELLDGEIIKMASMGNRHVFCLRWLNKALVIAIGDLAVVDAQLPILLDNWSEPEPDFAVLRWRDDHYRERPKGEPADVLLVIEVADTSAGFDRRYKAPLYAAHEIPEMWLFDLNRRQVEIHDQPRAGAYTRTRIAGIDDVLTPAALPQIAIPVSAVMPP